MIITRSMATDGMNKHLKPTSIGPFSPYMLNAIVDTDIIRKRRGYSELGGNLPLSGIGNALINYKDARGSSHLIALTSTKAYHYNTSTKDWDAITPVAGDFTGDADDNWTWALVHDDTEFANNGGTALVVSNNVDDLQYYEGDSEDKFEVLVHAFTNFANCKDIVEFWNHLFILNYNDGSNNIRSLAFADVGDVDNWSSGTSGAAVLTDSTGEILRAIKLGYEMIIYSEWSVTITQYYGGSTIFAFPTIVHENGLIGQRAVQSLNNDAHFFLSKDRRVYKYYGGTQFEAIGLAIESYLFSVMDVSKRARICTGFNPATRHVYFGVPTSGIDYPKTLFAVSYQTSEPVWEMYEFADSIRGMAIFNSTWAWYCDDADWTGVYCDESAIFCDDAAGINDFDQACFLSDDGYVFKLDEATGQDNGTDIVFEYWTQEFTIDDEETKARWSWFSFTAKSDVADATVVVQYSTDGGDTWTAFADSPVSLSIDWTTHRLPLSVVDRRIMFKIYQDSDKDIQLRGQFRCKVVQQTERD